jgi:hypothetical protein
VRRSGYAADGKFINTSKFANAMMRTMMQRVVDPDDVRPTSYQRAESETPSWYFSLLGKDLPVSEGSCIEKFRFFSMLL